MLCGNTVISNTSFITFKAPNVWTFIYLIGWYSADNDENLYSCNICEEFKSVFVQPIEDN